MLRLPMIGSGKANKHRRITRVRPDAIAVEKRNGNYWEWYKTILWRPTRDIIARMERERVELNCRLAEFNARRKS